MSLVVNYVAIIGNYSSGVNKCYNVSFSKSWRSCVGQTEPMQVFVIISGPVILDASHGGHRW